MKRILSILLSAVMLLGMLSALPAVAAENSATGYSQTIAEAGRSDDYKNLPNLNSSDVVDDTTNVLKEEFTSHMAFQVSDYAGLVNLQKLVEAGNSFAGITIYQTANIAPDSETEFSGIGTLLGSSAANYKMRPFSGTYDGQGYTIGNLKLTYGLFYRISGGYCTTESGKWDDTQGKANATPVTIKNVVIAKTCTVENTGNKTGAIVSQTVDFKCAAVLDMKVIISNCKSEAASVTGGDMTGGIAGAITQPTVISNCTNASPVTVTGKRGGGVVGRMAATSGYGNSISHTLINCLNTGTVNCTYTSASTGCGGLVGDIGVKVALVSGCVNTGDIKATMTSNALGEIVGKGSTTYAQLGLYNNTGRGALQNIGTAPNQGTVFTEPSSMKIVGVQTSAHADSKFNLRVITAVNDLTTYANIRYKVTVSGEKTNIYASQDTNAVYSSILASYGTETVNTAHKDVVNNNVQGKECQGLSALVIKNIPTSGTYIFTISVYGLKSDNTTEYWGHTVTVTVVNGVVQQ